MAATLPAEVDVLVVGAGPIGLTVALSLQARGRDVIAVDKLDEASMESRAAVVYPGTLEILDAYGVAERLAASGIRSARFTIRDRDRILMPVPFTQLPTRFPYALLIAQHVTESIISERLVALGGRVFRPFAVTDVTQDGSGATATFADGQHVRARFVVGADGVHSTVRDRAGIPFRYSGEPASYALGDVQSASGLSKDELHVYFSPAGHLVIVPLPDRIHRIVGHVQKAPEHPDAAFLQELVQTRGSERVAPTISDVTWSSRFLAHHALADRYRSGRIVLAGDAAHVHSPLGGQGMNLGIHDAIYLGKTLSAILAGEPDRLLDDYSRVQRKIAKQVIWITNLLTRVATLEGSAKTARNAALTALSPLIRRSLAWRLSLLYLRPH